MGALEPNKCVGCFSLRSGCIALGYFDMVTSGLGFFAYGLQMCGLPLTADLPDGSTGAQRSLYGVFSLLCLVSFAVCSLFLYGIYKMHPVYVRAYYQSMIPITILAAIVQFCDPRMENVMGVVAILLGCGVNTYMILCVRSYYLKMLDEKASDMGEV